MADSKLADLTNDATPTSDDLIYTVNDPGGTPADRKVTLANLATALAAFSAFTNTFVAKATAPVVIVIAASDESTTITAGTAKVTFRAPHAFTLTGVRASLTTASSSGGPFTVDINEAGTTVLSTKLTIDDGELTSTTAAAAAVISDSAIADDAVITIDVDDAGTGAVGLKVTLLGTRAL